MLFLQVDTANTLKDVVDRSIQLSRAINDLGALTVIAGIFLVLVLIMFGFFIYQLIHQQKELATISKTSDIVSRYFNYKLSKQVNLDQARSIVEKSYVRLRTLCIIQILKLRVDKQSSITEGELEGKLNIFLNTTERNHKNYLLKFEYKGKPISDIYEEPWLEEVYSCMLKYINKDNFDIYKTEDELKQIFGNYGNEFDETLTDLTNDI